MFEIKRALPWVSAAALLMTGAAASAYTEGFETPVPAGWTVINNSDPVGTGSWGTTGAIFPAHAGPADSFARVNFNSAGSSFPDPATISNWLVAPTMTFNDGDLVSFYTRTTLLSEFPDRLELRFSSVGGSDVGSGAFDVGTFTTLLVEVNPELQDAGYPQEWTAFSATISGLGGPTSGALAFRYFVEDGGPFGNNSNYIGVDSLSVTAIPEPAAWMLMAGGLAAVGLRRRRLLRDAA